MSRSFFLMAFGSHSLLALMLLCTTSNTHAQFFLSTSTPQDGVYQYRNLTPASSAANALTLFNAQGLENYVYRGDNIFGDPISTPAVSVFERNATRPLSYSYQNFVTPNNAADLLTQLNTLGSQGFLYIGDTFFAGVISSFVRKDSTTAAYSYRTVAQATTPAAFIALLNSEGAQGFSYQGNLAFTGGGGFSVVSLFARNTSINATYRYESLPPASSAANFVSQANAQGARGYHFRGNGAFGATPPFEIISFYEFDSARGENYAYEAITPATSASNFLTQANAQGLRRFSYIGDQSYDNVISSIYVAVRPLFTSNFE